MDRPFEMSRITDGTVFDGDFQQRNNFSGLLEGVRRRNGQRRVRKSNFGSCNVCRSSHGFLTGLPSASSAVNRAIFHVRVAITSSDNESNTSLDFDWRSVLPANSVSSRSSPDFYGAPMGHQATTRLWTNEFNNRGFELRRISTLHLSDVWSPVA